MRMDLRRRKSPASALLAAVAVTMAVAASCRTVPRPRAGGPVDQAGAPGPPPVAADTAGATFPALEGGGPIIRVGLLTDVPRASLAADSGLVVRGVVPAGASKDVRVQRATFVGASAVAWSRRFRVQVASLADEPAAKQIVGDVTRAAGMAPTVKWSPETRSYQVRVGGYATREEALALAGRMQQHGFSGGWVAEESTPEAEGKVHLLETGDDFSKVTVFPAKISEILSADGLPYRGLLEVRAGEPGVTVVNVLPIEDYLKGVVPNELAPQVFPHLEALKAQAVAARTYALRNRGQFASRGYDICATPTCQVYRGKSTEHPLSTQAVDETRGTAAYHRGSLINALYTSTCGGHTEHGSNIFDGEPTPYLEGVSCVPERDAWTSIHTTAAPQALGDSPGLGRDVAFLVSLDVLEPRLFTNVRGELSDAEARHWVTGLMAALHRKPCASAVEGSLSRRGSFIRHLWASMCWEERGTRLLSAEDAEYLLKVEDRDALLGDPERMAAATLIQEGVLAPFPDNTLRPGGTLTRTQAIEMIARAAQKVGPPALASATFQSARSGVLTVNERDEPREHPLDPAVRLFRALDGVRLGASSLDLVTGDKVRYVVQNGRVTFLEADQSLLGASADRTSKVYRWEVRQTPDELAQSLSRYGTVGRILDVVPRRFGVSGRVIEASVLGTDGEMPLRGLRVRWGLGLRENLFVVDRERDAAGRVQRFVFTGKGWGHGVGLCQVGSFGMAVAGGTYDRILAHYYTGINLGRAY